MASVDRKALARSDDGCGPDHTKHLFNRLVAVL